MEKFDYLDLTGHQLQILLTIQEAGSLSAAARMLDLNQSTISYWLDLLRKRTGDQLFIRQGNGVVPTERAQELLPAAQAALSHLESMFAPKHYHPQNDTGSLKIATTAVERHAVMKPFVDYALKVAPGLSLELRSQRSAHEIVEDLGNGSLDLAVLPPRFMGGKGLKHLPLLQTTDRVFFDPAYPLQEGDWDAFCARAQVRVGFGSDASFTIDRRLAKDGRKRHVALQVADFDTALYYVRGTSLIATLPATLSTPDLASVAPPWVKDPLDLSLVWHVRNDTSARHRYWRDVIKTQATPADPTL